MVFSIGGHVSELIIDRWHHPMVVNNSKYRQVTVENVEMVPKTGPNPRGSLEASEKGTGRSSRDLKIGKKLERMGQLGQESLSL